MSNIKKTFESFINEELKKDAYLNTAKELRKLGHDNRADKLELHARSKDEVAFISINDKEFELNESNVQVDDRYKTMNIKLFNNENNNDERLISINYKTDTLKVTGVEGIKNRRDANILYKFIRTMIEKNVDVYPTLEDLLTKLKVNHLYKN